MTAGACSPRRAPASRRSRPRPALGCGRATSRPTTAFRTSSPTPARSTRSSTSPGRTWPRCAQPTAASVWTSPSLSSGASSPALDADRVYVGFGGGQTYALSRATGQVVWHHDTCCSGGGGTTVVVHGGRLYAEAWTFKVLDPATGRDDRLLRRPQRHATTASPRSPATLGIFRPATGLLAAGPDGDDAVVVRRAGAAARSRPAGTRTPSSAASASTSPRPWSRSSSAAARRCGAPTSGSAPTPTGIAGPVSGGSGLIVVPVDDRLVAYGNGGTGSTCGGAPPHRRRRPAAAAPAAPAADRLRRRGLEPRGPRPSPDAARRAHAASRSASGRA